ncbi:electron transfer flavoprotein subunit alpha/FixB family protein [Flavobacteriaceae bacterium]|jgi:electron transfer flavoprotein alpha subunit|nr:electron transfer flavoprotein subunit alpha/FixB family protein [Flavobacteriales bacterium]MDA9850322.1 electron transfer flavoprotein subunit alpha/FixB family protein [Flavobacteriaceae bacterium]
MAILVYTESEKGKFKKIAFELASYARAIADENNTTVTAVCINAEDPIELQNYGVNKILNISNQELKSFNAISYSQSLLQAAENEKSNIIIISSSADSKYLAPLLAVKHNAGYISNASELPSSYNPLTVKRTAFTNKAFEITKVNTENVLISLAKNSYTINELKTETSLQDFSVNISPNDTNVKSIDKATNKVSIADADTVVSAGRGLKGPENWGMIEELAEVLGAATACSKPVSDLGWRPHGEHVGQTGKPVASNLYIAIGISGAIQHLAGINSSKVKVVINTDPDAPFFKAADYGVVGDAFVVVPELINKLKTFKAQN